MFITITTAVSTPGNFCSTSYRKLDEATELIKRMMIVVTVVHLVIRLYTKFPLVRNIINFPFEILQAAIQAAIDQPGELLHVLTIIIIRVIISIILENHQF